MASLGLSIITFDHKVIHIAFIIKLYCTFYKRLSF